MMTLLIVAITLVTTVERDDCYGGVRVEVYEGELVKVTCL